MKKGLSAGQVGQRPFEMGYKAMYFLKDMKDGKAAPEGPDLYRPRRLHAEDRRHLHRRLRRGRRQNRRPRRRRKNWAWTSQRPSRDRHEGATQKGDEPMTAKLDPFAAAPEPMKDWQRASYAIASGLEPTLVELVEIRASQINGCANCINMHAKEAREKGETEQRIYLLSAWREAPCYTDRERAALGWTDALTRISEGHTHASAREALRREFTRRGASQTHFDDQCHQWLEPRCGGLRPVRRSAAMKAAARRPPRDDDGGAAGGGGGFRRAASQADARSLSDARLGGRRGGRSAGGLHPLDEGRARGGAGARGLSAPHGHAALPRSAQIRATPARNLSRVPGFPSRSSRRTKRRTSRSR